MTEDQARAWADGMSPDRMKRKLAELDIWVAEEDGVVVGWVAIERDRVEGMYAEPNRAGRGIGRRMLDFAETRMAAAGFASARLDASWNAEAWYIRRGYEPTASRPLNAPRPMVKKLSS